MNLNDNRPGQEAPAYPVDHNHQHCHHGPVDLHAGVIVCLRERSGSWPSDLLARICGIVSHNGHVTARVCPVGMPAQIHEVPLGSLWPHACGECPHEPNRRPRFAWRTPA